MPTPKIDPYLVFDGNCAQAFEFYRDVLGAKIESIIPFKESPMAGSVPAEFGNRTMHAKLLIDGQVVMGSDAPPGQPFEGIGGFSLSANFPTVAQAKKAYDALSAGGAIQMPFDKTFWAAGFSMFKDRFGVAWMVGCEKES
ncbi:MAG TPA: VOC family protein [Polyangiaceae bacterium]|jgi:PhnB protein|nr:VOC family protein [Polyangiaceae bacterium]